MSRKKNQYQSFPCSSVSGPEESRELGSLRGAVDVAGSDILSLPPDLCLHLCPGRLSFTDWWPQLLCAVGWPRGGTSRRSEGRRESFGSGRGCASLWGQFLLGSPPLVGWLQLSLASSNTIPQADGWKLLPSLAAPGASIPLRVHLIPTMSL